MRNLACALLAGAVLTVASGGAALAQRDRDDHWRGGRDEHWRGDINRFHEHDFDLWRGGRWVRGAHDGRAGWWWVVGPQWYAYAAPVYPYPDPYVPPAIVAPTAARSWYFCANPQGYYPYVAQCAVPWQPVAAQ